MENRKLVSVAVVVLLFVALAARGDDREARRILDATGVQGGLVVHLGCGDGALTAGLGAGESYLVHGLDEDAGNIAKARDLISGKGFYGRVSVERWSGRVLPYSDNVVNLLVAEDLGDVPMAEVMRVLCPRGVAYLKKGAKWKKVVKPRPAEIDEWTHYLHDADNNAVAKDTRIATPNHLQWQGGPKRTRDHDALASMSAMTSSGGRIFYIFDEGLTSLIHHPASWKLIARDAFNGKVLWKRDIDAWQTPFRFFRTGPVQLPRLLVSVGQRVYATLGFGAPVRAMDAGTGRTVRTYKGSGGAEEFILDDGVLLVVVGDPQLWNRYSDKPDTYATFRDEEGPEAEKRIVAYDAETGKRLWRIEGDNLAKLAPLSLTAGDGKAYYLDHEKLYCVDLKSGEERWDSAFATRGLFLVSFAPTVVQYKDTISVLSVERLAVFSTKDGRKLWETKGYAGFGSPGDLFIINDTVWTFPTTQGVRVKPADVPGGGKEFLGFDLYTGEVKKRLVKKDVWPGGHHHRCYRNKATERYLISSRRGLEFVDLEGDDNIINWWVRAICQYGFMPCNGLIYAPPQPCQCFTDIKFDGFHALAASETPSETGGRLLKGKAYGDASLGGEGRDVKAAGAKSKGVIWAAPVANSDPQEWPTYRHDITRSGCASTKIGADLKRRWRTEVGGRLSSVVAAEGKVFVSSIDRQTVYCLDAGDGAEQWKFVAEGRVDSPPSIYGSTAIFGCRNGYVYAVRVSDGQLAWRFRAGPVDRRTVVRDRVESLWPVHGSVLVVDGVVYFAAGHTSYLDGGLRLFGLDAATGDVRCSRVLSSAGAGMDGVLPDILVCDGNSILMRQRRFDFSLRQSGLAGSAAIATSAGLLDDSWGHRYRWSWTLGGGDVFGNLLVFDEAEAFGVQSYYTFLKHDPSMHPGTHTGHLHQKYARYTAGEFPIGTRLFAQDNRKLEAGDPGKKQKPKLNANSHKWNRKSIVQFRAMVLAGDVLFGAGWKDSVKAFEKNPSRRNDSALLAISTADGETLKEYALGAEPVFDGMAGAYGGLYLALKDGSVVCLGGK